MLKHEPTGYNGIANESVESERLSETKYSSCKLLTRS